MAKNGIDGVYDADPRLNPGARRYEQLSHQEAIEKDLRVMDAAALSLCRENNVPILVFDIRDDQAIERAVDGAQVGTLVTAGESRFATA
jgi:uridylate kinase